MKVVNLQTLYNLPFDDESL